MQLVLVYDIKKWVTKSRQGKLVGRYASRGSFIQKVTENVQGCTVHRMYSVRRWTADKVGSY